MNLMQLTSRFDPSYSLKLQQLQSDIQSKYDIANINNNAALHRENVKSGYELERQNIKENGAMERERFRLSREDSRLDRTISAQFELEETRGKSALEVERLRGSNSVSLANVSHSNNLAISATEQKNAIMRMEYELRTQIEKSGFDSGVLAVQKLIDQDDKKRLSLTTQMESRALLRGRIQEKLIDAVIEVRTSRFKHDLEIQRMEKQSSLSQADTYFNMVTGYVFSLLNTGKEQEAKDEIDRLIRQWESV
jgi:hypothetical protein